MTRWIASLLVVFIVGVVVDRFTPPMADGTSGALAEAAAPTPPMPIEPSTVSVGTLLLPPVDPSRVLGVEVVAPEPGSGEEALHIACPRGTPVRSSFAAEVFATSHLTSSGITIDLLDEAGRRIARYGHLLRLRDGLEPGRRVAAGDVIGWVGDTGAVAPGAAALHFCVREVPEHGEWWRSPCRPLLDLYSTTPIASSPG